MTCKNEQVKHCLELESLDKFHFVRAAFLNDPGFGKIFAKRGRNPCEPT